MKSWFLGAGGALLCAGSAVAGTFQKIERDDLMYQPFVIVHPYGYDGTGGEIELKLCPAELLFKEPLQAAIAIWDTLVATTGNCEGCRLLEEADPSPSGPYDLTSVLLHEIGHCAMGLGHTNWMGTSFTATRTVDAIDDGADMVRGSRDDTPTPLPGSRVIHWFRLSDNNPVVVDATTIDANTCTRRILDLPPGHTWAASANRAVAEALGFPNTQGTMYSLIGSNSRYTNLAADEINTVRLGMAGIDTVAGTADDYTVKLTYESNCAAADIVIQYYTPQPGDDPRILRGCVADIEQISRDNTVHYRVYQFPRIGTKPYIEINDTVRFDAMFTDDFESGDLSKWSDSEP